MSEFARNTKVISLSLAIAIGASATHHILESTFNNTFRTSINTDPTANDNSEIHYGEHTYTEEVQSKIGVSAFKNYYFVTGENPQRIPHDEKIKVNCIAFGPIAIAPTALGSWYHIVAPKEWAGEYSASNDFL